MFDKLVRVLVLGAAYDKIADSTCSATKIRTRHDEWVEAGIFTELEQICLDAYDRLIGLDRSDLSVGGCIVKAPCGGEAAGRSPVDRGKQGTKPLVMVDGWGIPTEMLERRRTPQRLSTAAAPWPTSAASTKASASSPST